ncbi:transcription initiation factor IID, 18kD subunit-domain-containing protein [Mycotypha africana]|uniref:transcription initiation factor IID, 18kD subunit-domain-containing protein n=1 Tax=Mycotypha africana TaxID=64632 RepID=UPI0023019306|nr:transcription initiation factor IID, 18kD subunit-domain-containing protein [Mycotypha africana]KAI8975031.1 transcription initiation factor IID, 18kD subunit-domain-containing protein [Mycotypha africana]
MSDNKEGKEARDTKEAKEHREPGVGPGRRKTVRKGMFSRDLKLLMYGFGDVLNPAADSIAVLDDLVIDYIVDMCQKASKVAENRGKVKVEDFKFVLRNDAKKLARVEELLYMSEDIRRAKQVFDEKEMEADDG